jgi:hypothetical protein
MKLKVTKAEMLRVSKDVKDLSMTFGSFARALQNASDIAGSLQVDGSADYTQAITAIYNDLNRMSISLTDSGEMLRIQAGNYGATNEAISQAARRLKGLS